MSGEEPGNQDSGSRRPATRWPCLTSEALSALGGLPAARRVTGSVVQAAVGVADLSASHQRRLWLNQLVDEDPRGPSLVPLRAPAPVTGEQPADLRRHERMNDVRSVALLVWRRAGGSTLYQFRGDESDIRARKWSQVIDSREKWS